VRRAAALLLVALLGLGAAASPLRLTVRPGVFAPYGNDLEIRWHVARSAAWQRVDVLVEGSSGLTRATEDTIEPGGAPTRRALWIRTPAAGLYRITARLYARADSGRFELRATAATHTEIVGGP
jgi:hypothetical protein